MEEILVGKINNFDELIKSMEVNKRYMFVENMPYKWIRFEKTKKYGSEEIHYSWAMEYNYKVAGTTGYIYPMSTSHRVTHFRTEAGAKNNFIKRYKDVFSRCKTDKS